MIINVDGREIIEKLKALSSVTTNKNANKFWLIIRRPRARTFAVVQATFEQATGKNVRADYTMLSTYNNRYIYCTLIEEN